MKLSALSDFPDDARLVYTRETLDRMMSRIKDAGVTRVYFQHFGNKEYGYFWDHNAPIHKGMLKTAENLPEITHEFADMAKKYGLETAVIMKPLEQGIWLTYSPYFPEAAEGKGIDCIDGKMLITTNFMRENPHLRIKRRSWDIDPDVNSKTIAKIKLYKQNDKHTRIGKENITIYTSANNSYYKEYTGDFTVSFSTEKAKRETVISHFRMNYPSDKITNAGDNIEVMTISGLKITDKFIAVGVSCSGPAEEEVLFRNVPCNMISIHEEDGTPICSTPGSAVRSIHPVPIPKESGFNYNDGFGRIFEIVLDKPGEEGFIAICKGKQEYAHGTPCVCEPEVREHWFKWLEKAMDADYDLVGHRLECHSMHVDEPEEYGYNDCIKEEYFKRYGQCTEEEMDLDKIAVIRGDAYTEYFKEAARRIRARGKKVILTLNLEMLYNPVPAVRNMAYPANVQWQWQKWIEQMNPDEINIRTYQMSPDFIFSDPQCLEIINKARGYGIPMTLERYVYWDFAADFEMVRDLDIFERMTLYEIYEVIQSDGKGGINVVKPELLDKLAELTKEQT